MKNGKRKSASKREQRKCIYSAEREQIQDDKVGLKRETGNGELTYPLRSVAPRPPNLEGQRVLSVITNFLPLRQGESRRGGGMMKRNGEICE